MITFDPEQFRFAPMRTVYSFHLTITEKFATEILHLTDTETSFLQSRIAIGRSWPSVWMGIEDWRSHLVLNVKEGDPFSLAQSSEGKRQSKHGGDDWGYERRDRQQTVYAHHFTGELDVWRRYLSEAREEYISLDVVERSTIRFCALEGRFGRSWLPDRIDPGNENTYLRLNLGNENTLQPYSVQTNKSQNNADWQRSYRNEEVNGLAWELSIVDLQMYLERQFS